MSVILGSGEHRYEVIDNWAKLPPGWSFKDVGAVATDSKDQVYVFNRGEHPDEPIPANLRWSQKLRRLK